MIAIQSCRETSEDMEYSSCLSIYCTFIMFFIYFLELANKPEIHFYYMKKKTFYKTQTTQKKNGHMVLHGR